MGHRDVGDGYGSATVPSDHSHPLESTLATSEWSVYLARTIPTGNHHAKRFSSVHSRLTLAW